MCFLGSDEELDRDGPVQGSALAIFPDANKKVREAERRETERLAQQVPPAPNPFAVLSNRIGIQSISDVRPGERGRRVSVGDIKVGLK